MNVNPKATMDTEPLPRPIETLKTERLNEVTLYYANVDWDGRRQFGEARKSDRSMVPHATRQGAMEELVTMIDAYSQSVVSASIVSVIWQFE